jgi:hypothetical protein
MCVCVRIGRFARKFRETHHLQVNSTSIKFTARIRFQSAAAADIIIEMTAGRTVRPGATDQLIT